MAVEENVNIDKARAFFQRAQQVSRSENFDYAIELYLDGLRCAPDALEQGHLELHNLALTRQARGGKRPSVMEKARRLRAKGPLEKMLNAEYLFAKDPDHLPYAETMLKAAVQGEYKKTAQWLADFIFGANNEADKPSFKTYLLLKDCYYRLGFFNGAVAACQKAAQIRPENSQLDDELKQLAAEMAVSRGKYDQGGNFRQSLKDRKGQEELQARSAMLKSDQYRQSVVEQARSALQQEPELPKNIFNLANALTEQQTDEAENEAVELLIDAYQNKKDFGFKQQAEKIKINQLKRKIRQGKASLEKNPDDTQAKSELTALVRKFNRTELELYRECVENYPTDMQLKYEYGIRLFRNKKFDDAIPLFQDAQKDPRHKIAAMNKIGLCFFMKEWFTDAIDLFNRAIEQYDVSDDGTAKELRYNLARAYERDGQEAQALENYRKIAQMDFSYKDVRRRIGDLRGK